MRASRLLAAFLLVSACRTDCTPRDGAGRTSVVLVTVDTLRADHLGCHGHPAVRTPHTDRLAREGAHFDHCYAQTHITIPSHLSILSSLPLIAHGALYNEMPPAASVPVLPDWFAAAGYRTAAFVSAAHLGPNGTLGPLLRGLEAYEAPRRLSQPFPAEETNRRMFRWLRGACRDPFFVWVHYWDPHMPYQPPAPFDTAYYRGDPRDPGQTSMADVELPFSLYLVDGLRRYLGPVAADVRALKQKLALNGRDVRQLVLRRAALDVPLDAEAHHRLDRVGAHVRRRLPLRPNLADWLTDIRDVRFPLAQYMGEVSYVDREIGHLREELERLGLARRTVVVVTADHGESLGEHGVWFNHFGLHDPNVRVPLVFWAPGRIAPSRRREPVRSIDIAPTVLHLAGLTAPAVLHGRDLLGAPGRAPPVVAEAMGGQQLMLLDGRWKLIRTLRSFHYVDAFARDAGRTELYDLDADVAERDDLAARRPDVTADLSARLDAWLAAQGSTPDGAAYRAPRARVPSAKVQDLRALGYVDE